MQRLGNRPHSSAFIHICLALSAAVLSFPSSTIAQEEKGTKLDVPEQTVTFRAENPYTSTPGEVRITFAGSLRVHNSQEEVFADGVPVTGTQLGTFIFVPDNQSEPTYSAAFRFGLSGEVYKGKIVFAFSVDGKGSDGSTLTFIQGQSAVFSDTGVEVQFGRLERLVPQS